MVRTLLFLFNFLFLSVLVFSQNSLKDHIIEGNEAYAGGNYQKAELNYKRALSVDNQSTKANYNLGNALYKLERYEEARAHYDKALKRAETAKEQHQILHNIGKSFFDEGKYLEAMNNFKSALKKNPYDDQTRYNYALAKKLLEEQNEGEEDSSKPNNEQNKNGGEEDGMQKKEEDGSESNQPEGEKEQESEGKKDGGGHDKGDRGSGEESPENSQFKKGGEGGKESPGEQITAKEYEGILQGLEHQEQETHRKIFDQRAKKSNKRTEKDW